MVYFVEGFVSILLQVELAIACLAFALLTTNHAYNQNLTYCAAFWTQACCNVLRSACSWFYSFSPYHYWKESQIRFIKSKGSVSAVRSRLWVLMKAEEGFKGRSQKARGVGFEPTGPYGHGISNPTPYQARRPPHRCCSKLDC